VSKVKNYCYDEKNFKVPIMKAVEQVLGGVQIAISHLLQSSISERGKPLWAAGRDAIILEKKEI
jgi:hypothetical protein